MHILKIEKYLLIIYNGFFVYFFLMLITVLFPLIWMQFIVFITFWRRAYRDCFVMSNCYMKTILISAWTPHYNDKLSRQNGSNVSMETKLQCQIDGKMRSIQIYTDQTVMLKQCRAVSPQVWGGGALVPGWWERDIEGDGKQCQGRCPWDSQQPASGRPCRRTPWLMHISPAVRETEQNKEEGKYSDPKYCFIVSSQKPSA